MTGIEERLRDALAARAETVRDDGTPRVLPAPRARWSGGRWWAPVAVAAAIVVVVAATVVATRAVAPPIPAARPTPSPAGLARPVRQVWPDAVHEIPATAPGGRTFLPDAFVADRVVVGQALTKNRSDGIWSYDVDERRFTRITPLVKGHAPVGPVVAGDGYVAWSAVHDGSVEIWAVPAGGGVPRHLASVTARASDKIFGARSLAITDGMAVWSASDGGVYRVLLDSKGAEWDLVLGSTGFHLVEWPWAGQPGPDRSATRPMEHLKNVVTGETRDAQAPSGRTSWSDCGLTWCFDGVAAWRRDGTGLRALPGQVANLLLSGRFVLLRQSDSAGRGAVAVHDIATGRTGLLFETQDGKPWPALRPRDGMVRYLTGRGTQVVVDLTRAAR
ncbi:hypothetical protein GCM10010149_59710 [Nonomuraea roseoviolacea subsp. roseoviolacea]|uniref:hypothetical protein n=1 Tax=Nonomuraea roseoviolacea TaxID=103837 RepID=UPI0031D1A6CB